MHLSMWSGCSRNLKLLNFLSTFYQLCSSWVINNYSRRKFVFFFLDHFGDSLMMWEKLLHWFWEIISLLFCFSLSLSSLWFAPLPLSLPLALSLSPSLSLLYLYLLTPPPPPPPPPLLLSSASKSAIHGAKASFSPFSSRMAFFKYLRSVKNELILFSAPLLLLPLPLVIGTSVCKWCGRDNRFNLTLSQCWKSRGVKKKTFLGDLGVKLIETLHLWLVCLFVGNMRTQNVFNLLL